LIPLYQIMIKLHLVDTYVGVALIYVSAFLPLSLWLFEASSKLFRSHWRKRLNSMEQAGFTSSSTSSAAGRTRADGSGDPDFPGGLGTVSRSAHLLAAGDEALDGSHPGIRDEELHRLRPDHGQRLDRDRHPRPRRHFSQPLPRQRPAGWFGQIIGDFMNTTEKVIFEQFRYWEKAIGSNART
jgi:hypothetical protein